MSKLTPALNVALGKFDPFRELGQHEARGEPKYVSITSNRITLATMPLADELPGEGQHCDMVVDEDNGS